MRATVTCLALMIASCGCSADAPAPIWNGSFDGAVARPEHPRPDLRRADYVSLDTRWQFAYDPQDVGLADAWATSDDPAIWTETIQLPFAWDSPLSGLVPPHDGDYKAFAQLDGKASYHGVAWYRLQLPGSLRDDGDGQHWYVVFGAVDYRATVFVNGREAATHEGGYSPFAVDLAQYVPPGQRAVIVVRVEDPPDGADALTQPRGKQGGYWYTPTSGIWQPVYLERRPAVHLSSYRVVTDAQRGRVALRVVLSDAARGQSVRVHAVAALESDPDVPLGEAQTTSSSGEATLDIELSRVVPWEPDLPALYALRIEVEAAGAAAPDVVDGYFGVARFDTRWLPGHGPSDGVPLREQYRAIALNGRPRYLRCVLDQAYWPDGIMTAPTLAAMRRDLELARRLGFNCIRVHAKVDEPLKYRLLDEMGFIAIYDFAPLDLRAANSASFAGRGRFEQHMRRAIARDANHPSIAYWVVFNENWGLSALGRGLITPLANDADTLGWAKSMVALARRLDPTRPVEDNSAGGLVGRYEHFDTDVQTFHYYSENIAELRATLAREAQGVYPTSAHDFIGGGVQHGQPWLNSEIAPFSFLGTPTPDTMCTLWRQVNELRRRPRLMGFVLTQLTDVEFERNGFVHYDRSPRDLCERDGVTSADLLAANFIAFDALPPLHLSAGTTAQIALRYSHWSDASTTKASVTLRWADGAARVEAPLTVTPLGITSLTVALPVVGSTGARALVAEVHDDAGKRLAVNRLDVVVE